MKKIKMLLIAFLTCICTFVFSSCEMVWTSIYITAISLGLAVEGTTPPPQELPAEIVEALTITDVEQDEDGWYVVTVEGAIKNAGDLNGGSVFMHVAFYDENEYLLEYSYISLVYIGAGETANVREQFNFQLAPTSVKVKEVTIEEETLTASEKKDRKKVELLSEGTLLCTLGEDGLYHTIVTGKVKLIEDVSREIEVCTALYDADGYMHFADWRKTVLPNEEREFTIEYVSEEEIVSHKLLYGTVYHYDW